MLPWTSKFNTYGTIESRDKLANRVEDKDLDFSISGERRTDLAFSCTSSIEPPGSRAARGSGGLACNPVFRDY
ncbi:protein of unknown function [Methylocaldum szegediense]|uniref:Uncharacterized protein n=1 Tax=Methylocaldum szegediense TaxID=73780 RepID=A0ABM9I0V2_9GAMM|nr:protein of unknown function [Methylocaldum szegediense]